MEFPKKKLVAHLQDSFDLELGRTDVLKFCEIDVDRLSANPTRVAGVYGFFYDWKGNFEKVTIRLSDQELIVASEMSKPKHPIIFNTVRSLIYGDYAELTKFGKVLRSRF